ncbi:HigA family addiction module antitoxin [Bartonella vinsonii]|uniref:HigA family addiction module antitoxin n=1 Tax=Bartonella vinsonii TaxID=33047 RepID=UPI0002B6E208|nr:HigA family addiction module antitoxin [Bartonella vinsonii]AGF75761.1 virulence-associated protein A [Bartonella vinsonii subsp. berkhoffii str. Winnie]
MLFCGIHHPGEVLKVAFLEEMGITIQKLADHLHMTRASLSRVINGRASISTELAVKLELAGFSKAKFWLDMQTNYNLWQTMQRVQPPICPLVSDSVQTPL